MGRTQEKHTSLHSLGIFPFAPLESNGICHEGGSPQRQRTRHKRHTCEPHRRQHEAFTEKQFMTLHYDNESVHWLLCGRWG